MWYNIKVFQKPVSLAWSEFTRPIHKIEGLLYTLSEQ